MPEVEISKNVLEAARQEPKVERNFLKRKLSVGSVDEEYEPTLEEHIGGSVDDESSILNDEDERNSEEIDTLKKEGDLPIEELMAIYGFPNKEIDYIKFKEDSQEESGSDVESETEQRMHMYDKDDWKKEILIGPDYQAEIPSLLENAQSDTENVDTLLWSPDKLQDREVVEYLSLVYSTDDELPVADVNRDDEEALYCLHKNGYKIDAALAGQANSDIKKQMKPWSEAECQAFENGLKIYGKQFNQIHKNLVPGRSINEIIQFYYLWKKTERYDIFIQYSRLGTKRYIFNPGQPLDIDRSSYICNNTQQHNTDPQESEHSASALPCT